MRLLLALLIAVPAFAEPNIAQWEANFKQYGATHCSAIPSVPYPTDAFGMTYYDMGRVYYQAADYFGDAAWKTCGDRATALYRDQYVIPNNGGVSGYWKFTDGMRREGSTASVTAIGLVTQNGAFADCSIGWGLTNCPLPQNSREVAYTLLTLDNARALSLPQYTQAKWDSALAAADSHVAAWLGGSPAQPFMVGLTAEALIRSKGDGALAQIKALADLLRPKWTGKSFPYLNNDGTTSEAADLNMLIAPLYAWMCVRDLSYCAFADEVFNAGVSYAYLGGAKQFNQNYRWSFDFIKWRRLSVPTPTRTPTPTATPTKAPTPWTITSPRCGEKLTLTWR